MQEEISKKIQASEKQMKEFSLSLERLNQEYQELLNDLELTPEQIKTNIENPAYFSSEAREAIEQEQRKLDEKLNLALNNVKDLKKAEETFDTLKTIQQHWLFVR